MDIAHNSSYKQIFPIILGGAGLCCVLPPAIADVTFDGTLGPGGTLDGAMMEITADRGQIAGNNLFHSFSEFNVNTGQTANFSGPDNVQNIFGRVTGSNPSTIDGIISSSIPGANLFLMNPNGMMFGPNAQINISGSFHATTADYLSFGNQERFYADINQNTTLSVAAPSAFGFLDNNVSDLTIDGSQLSVTDSTGITISAGDIEITNGGTISAPDGRINISSVKSAGEVATDQEQTEFDTFTKLGSININNASSVSATGAFGGRVVIRGGELIVEASTVSADTEIYAMQIEPNIDIDTRESITVDNSGKISADLKMFAEGTPTGVQIKTSTLNVANGSFVQALADFLSFGNAGNINVNAKHILLDNYSQISTSTSSTGNSGNITIENAESLDITNASSIRSSADTFLGEGKSGDISIHADYINIIGLEDPLDPEVFDFTGIDAGNSLLTGNTTGNINIDTKDLYLSNLAQIRTFTTGEFNSGDIGITSNNIIIEKGAAIISGSAFGESGNITIDNSEKLLVTGISPHPNLFTNNYRASSILTDGGSNSNISIISNEIHVLDGAKIISQNNFSPSGSSGNISLTARMISISGINETFFDSLISNGKSIKEAENFSRSQIKSSALVDSTQSNSTSSAGSIIIETDKLYVNKKGSIEATSISEFGEALTGDSGNIVINAKDILLNNASLLTSASNANGGNIAINSSNSLLIDSSQVSSSVETDAGNGGNLELSSSFIVLNDSSFTATASAGNGGNISVNANVLLLPDTNVFDASSEVAVNGQVSINSNLTIEKDLEKLPSQSEDISKSFADNCMEMNQRKKSSLSSNFTRDQYIGDSVNLPSEYSFILDPGSLASITIQNSTLNDYDSKKPNLNLVFSDYNCYKMNNNESQL